MLRITTADDGRGITRLRVEGRVTGETMEELRSVCEDRLRDQHTLVVDVAGVAYADAAGASLLRSLEHHGAALVGANGFLFELMSRSGEAVASEPFQRKITNGRQRDGSHAPARESRPQAEHARNRSKEARPKRGAAVEDDSQSLVARIRAGDEMACELVVRRFAGRLLSVARRVLGNEDEARDALQDAFLSAFRNIDSFTGEAQLSTWLHRIVLNASLMRLRSRRRRPEQSIDDLLPQFSEDGYWLEQPTSWRADELLERDETRAAVRRAIESLPARHREVLMLRDIEELDTAEVADLLGITTNAVKVRLHRARQALRTLIERELVG